MPHPACGKSTYHCDSTKTIGKGMNPTILLSAMGKIAEKTELFSLSMATGLGEGKLWIQTWKNWPGVVYCSCSGVGKYIHHCDLIFKFFI